jgi:pimeloyl-ACP methyl ester carboxylesterase
MTTLVLIHGGAYTGRYWDLLIDKLSSEALAVDLPGRGAHPADLHTVTLTEAVDSVADDLSHIDDEIVIVAHSSGGLVVPGVVSKLKDKAKHIVLNAASVPPEGGQGLDCMHERHRDAVRSIGDMIAAGQSIATPGEPPEPDRLRRAYGGADLSAAQIEFLRDPVRFVPDSYNFYFSPVHWSSVADVPVTYVLNLRDRAVPLTLQLEMISRLPGSPRTIPLDVGHMPAVTMPVVLAALLDGIAEYSA